MLFKVKSISAVILFLALASLTGAPGLAASSDPGQFVRTLGDEVLSIIQASDLGMEQRRQRYLRLFEQNFDVERMARFAIGRHWDRLNDAERARYQQTFRAYVIQLYADRFSDYKGEKFSVVDRVAESGNQWRVPAHITGPDGSDVTLTFVVEKPEDRFIVVDVVVEGASLLITKRSEFESVIERKGVEGFLDDLQRVTERMGGQGVAGSSEGRS